MNIASTKSAEIASQISSLLAVAFSVSICAAGLYEIAYFGTLRISIRSIPFGIVDFTLEIIRILPIGLALTLGYAATALDLGNLRRRENYVIQTEGISLTARKKLWRLRRFKLRQRLRVLIPLGLMIFAAFMFNIVGRLWFQDLVIPAISIFIAAFCAYLLCIWFVQFLGSGVVSHALVVLAGIAVIASWGTVSAVTAIDNADKANLTIDFQTLQELPVRVIGTYDRGILVMYQGRIEFFVWDLVKKLDYGAPDRVKIMESLVCGPKGPPNCLTEDEASQFSK